MHASAYQSALNSRFDSLDPSLQALHDGRPVAATGELQVERGSNLISRAAAVIMRVPLESPATTVTLSVDRPSTGRKSGRELWKRTFGKRRVDTWQWFQNGSLCESSGPFVMRFDLSVTDGSLTMHSVRTFLLGIPLPVFLSPKVFAQETAVPGGWMVEVEIRLPIIGRMVRYHGTMYLDRDETQPTIVAGKAKPTFSGHNEV